MNSINNIVKFNYESESKSPIRVLEYLLLTTENDKYLMFRLKNELEQRVKKIEFNLQLFNEDNYLIEEIKFSFEETHNGYEEFIPERKLKIEQEFSSLKIVVLSAEFDKVIYKDGEISKIVYSKDDFKKDSIGFSQAPGVSYSSNDKWDKKTKKLEYKDKKKYYKNAKKNKYAKDIIKINYSKKARVFSVIFMLIIVAYFVVSLIYFVNVADGFTDKTFNYTIIENNEVEITSLNSSKAELVIPEKVNGYTVSTIKKGAFTNKTSITSLKINAKNLKIEAKAFAGCSNLTAISNQDNILTVGDSAFLGTGLKTINLKNATEIYEYAFAETNITYAAMPKALVHMNAFAGVPNMEYLNVGSIVSGTSITALFGTTPYNSLARLHTGDLNLTSIYFRGLNKLSQLTLENENVSFSFASILSLNVNYLGFNSKNSKAYEFTGSLYFDTICLKNNGTYADKVLSTSYTTNVIFKNGKITTSSLESITKVVNIYFKSDADYSSVDFDTILAQNYNISLYFEDSIPSTISSKYRTRCTGNVSDAKMESIMIIAA